MAMSKQDFIALADTIREHNEAKTRVWGANANRMLFNDEQLDALEAFCKQQNPRFMAGRWRAYIKGECGKSGGAIKTPKVKSTSEDSNAR